MKMSAYMVLFTALSLIVTVNGIKFHIATKLKVKLLGQKKDIQFPKVKVGSFQRIGNGFMEDLGLDIIVLLRIFQISVVQVTMTHITLLRNLPLNDINGLVCPLNSGEQIFIIKTTILSNSQKIKSFKINRIFPGWQF